MSTRQQSEVVTEVRPGGEVGRKMVRLSVEVRSGTARFRVGAQAQSIREALSMVGGKFPHGEVGVVFPIESECFFVEDAAAVAWIVGTEQIHQEAA